jgi:hypothetical protein
VFHKPAPGLERVVIVAGKHATGNPAQRRTGEVATYRIRREATDAGRLLEYLATALGVLHRLLTGRYIRIGVQR